MNIETITKLIDAGYTKAEIEKLDAAGTAEPETGEPETGEPETGKPDGVADSAAETGVNTDAAVKALTDTVNALKETVAAMQANNVKGATGGKPEKSTIDEVLKSFTDTL